MVALSSQVIWGICAFVLTVGVQFLVSRRTLFGEADHLHLRRKVQHIASGVVIIFFGTCLLSRTYALYALAAGWCFLLLGHTLRWLFPPFNTILVARFGALLKPHEHHSLPGAFYFLFGSFCAVYVAELDVGMCAVLLVTAGDPAASLMGQLYGTTKWSRDGRKTIVGSICMLLICTGLTFAYVQLMLPLATMPDVINNETSANHWPLLAQLRWSVMAGAFASAVEVLPFPVDDNFSIPFFTAVGMKYLAPPLH